MTNYVTGEHDLRNQKILVDPHQTACLKHYHQTASQSRLFASVIYHTGIPTVTCLKSYTLDWMWLGIPEKHIVGYHSMTITWSCISICLTSIFCTIGLSLDTNWALGASTAICPIATSAVHKLADSKLRFSSQNCQHQQHNTYGSSHEKLYTWLSGSSWYPRDKTKSFILTSCLQSSKGMEMSWKKFNMQFKLFMVKT